MLIPSPEAVAHARARQLAIRRLVAQALAGQSRAIQIGRSRNVASFGSGTPINVIDGTGAPELRGQPYLKTQFCGRNGFRRTLYTPSTLHATVGREWLAKQGIA